MHSLVDNSCVIGLNIGDNVCLSFLHHFHLTGYFVPYDFYFLIIYLMETGSLHITSVRLEPEIL